MNELVELNMDEAMDIDGGGLVGLFLSCVGLSVSPAVACLCPPAGAGLALICGGNFVNYVTSH